MRKSCIIVINATIVNRDRDQRDDELKLAGNSNPKMNLDSNKSGGAAFCPTSVFVRSS
jgi:hypothetical protein